MLARKKLLFDLLESMVREWGIEAIDGALKRITLDRDGLHSPLNVRRSKERTSAKTQVERSALSREKLEPLLILADKYDKKEFLPSVADAREFIIMTGHRPPSMKDRRDAFSKLLIFLRDLSPDRLAQIAEAASYAGLAELGPISDAISSASERLPRVRQEALHR